MKHCAELPEPLWCAALLFSPPSPGKKTGRESAMNILKTLWKAIDIFLAMSGLRLDAGRFLLAWIPLLGACVCLIYQAERHGCLVEFAIASWVFYYVGISLILGTRIKRLMNDHQEGNKESAA